MPRTITFCLLGFFAFAGFEGGTKLLAQAASDSKAAPEPRFNPDQRQLLVYRDADGREQPVGDLKSWARRRQQILANMQKVMGPLPGPEKRCPLDLRLEKEVDEGTYVVRLISYASEPNARVPAFLLIPKEALQGKARYPAVLTLPGTGGAHKSFTKEALERGELLKPDITRNYARDLAERGYVTLVLPYPILGAYNPDLKALGYQSGTMKAIWDNIRGLDLLESLPYVQPGRFGAIGHSLGGHNSVFTAAFEERIQVVVSSCGLDSFVDYMGGKIKGWTQQRYMPKLWDYPLTEIPFDFHEVLAAVAPRRCLISAPTGDSNFRWRSAAAVVKAARQAYQLHGAADNLRIEHPNCGHEFPPEARAIAYRLLDDHLRTLGKPKDHLPAIPPRVK